MADDAPGTLEFDQIQGILFSGYAKLPAASYLLLHFAGEAPRTQSWLRSLIARLGFNQYRKEPERRNLAFTNAGLQALGLGAADLATFDTAFQDGMSSQRRAQRLGDLADQSPEQWRWGEATGASPLPIHALLMLYAAEAESLARLVAAELELAAAQGLAPVVPPLESPVAEPGFERKEHFGFEDGVSALIIAGTAGEEKLKDKPDPLVAQLDVLPAGEFILGYLNEYQQITQVPVAEGAPKFGRNGSYLVMRQLEQDVAAFWTFLESIAEAQPEAGRSAEWFGAKMVGRWPSGALVRAGDLSDPGGEPERGVSYAGDPMGYGVPQGAHIRRTNPRDHGLGDTPDESRMVARRHRILRRGRVYGPRLEDRTADDGQERGLFFICLNTNLERQFEFVQQTWANNFQFAGRYDENDPMLGPLDEDRPKSYTIPEHPYRVRIEGLQRFVTMRGGAYFFLPGRAALEFLAGGV